MPGVTQGPLNNAEKAKKTGPKGKRPSRKADQEDIQEASCQRPLRGLSKRAKKGPVRYTNEEAGDDDV